MSESRTFVLIHGAFHGGWCWRDVARILRAQGHQVFTPTQTGLGERAHLISREITLDTFVQDIANVIEKEDLTDIVLVGHSFGGNATSGIADRMPERIRHLVYLDAMLLPGGRKPFDELPADVVATRTRLADETSQGLSIPPPEPAAFGVFEADQVAWVTPKLTPHPMGTYTSPLNIAGPIGNNLPRTYVICTDPYYMPLKGARDWVAAQPGWAIAELATGHDAMVSAPQETADLLMRIAG